MLADGVGGRSRSIDSQLMSSSLLRSPSGVVDLFEAAHDAEPDTQRWTLRVLEGAQRVFRGEQPLAVSVFTAGPERVDLLGHAQGAVTSDGSAVGELLKEMGLRDHGDRYSVPLSVEAKQAFGELDPRWVDVFYRHRQHLTFHHTLVKRLPLGVADINKPFFEAGGFVDALAIQGVAPDASVAIVAPLTRKSRLLPRDKQVLLQVALHLEVSLRARREPGAVVAIIEPDGRVAHAEGAGAQAGSEHLRSRLAASVRQIEQVRRPSLRTSPEAADVWTALVQGRWALLERTCADGRRSYLVVDCAPPTQDSRKLSATELAAVQLAARGLSGKQISYALGLSSGTVSSALRTAALKLGCRSPAALVQLAARLLSVDPTQRPLSELTQAEAGVLALVREGLTNAQIARRRRSSPNTVANQVATLLRKLGLSSRRAAAALPATLL